jgi:hypothetical protein
VRLGNICQISYKVAQVSGTAQAVDHAGRDNELAYQEMLKGLELKRDMEFNLVGTNQAKNTGSTTVARNLRVGRFVDQVQHDKNSASGTAAPTRRLRTAPARVPTPPT